MGACRAVKVVYRQSFDNDRPFEREFHGIEKFEPSSRSHESQVNILHVGRGEGYFYYVMELADDGNDERAARSADFDRRVLMSAATYTPKTLKSEKQRRGRLPFSECLEIGLSLTTALGHLHKHGLVHRDIKPSNIIFVNGIPKLADIGLVTGSDVTGSFVGTEGFIPPEGPGSAQADIFALGKVLYEISSGKDRHEFPEPPTLLGEFADREDLLELDEVIQHACAYDTGKRYPTAEAMEADLLLLKTGRSVRQTHVLARRLTVATRVGVAAGVIALLALGASLMARNQARRARETSEREARLRQEAETAHASETRLRLQAEANAKQSKTEAAKSKQVAHFLEDMLAGVGPSVALGRDTALLREVLDKTIARVNRDLKEQPEVEAELRHRIGLVYLDLGESTKADAIQREALAIRRRVLGNDSLEVAESLHSLGFVLQQRYRIDEAGPFYLEGLAIRRRVLGNESLEVAQSLAGVGYFLFAGEHKLAEAESTFREGLRIYRKLLGNEHSYVAQALDNLSLVVTARGRAPEAQTMCREALAIRRKLLGNEHLEVAKSLNYLAMSLRDNGAAAEAETLLREAVTIQKKLLGNEHFSVAPLLNNLGTLLQSEGKLAEAETMEREFLQIERKLLGPDKPRLATWIDNLASVLGQEGGKWTEVEALRREALAIRTRLLDTNDVLLGWSYGNLAHVLEKQGRKAEADSMEREEVKIYRAGADSGNVRSQYALARLLMNANDVAGAVALAEQAVAGTNRKNPVYLDTLAAACSKLGQYARAASLEQEAIPLLPDSDSKKTFTSRQKLYESKALLQKP